MKKARILSKGHIKKLPTKKDLEILSKPRSYNFNRAKDLARKEVKELYAAFNQSGMGRALCRTDLELLYLDGYEQGAKDMAEVAQTLSAQSMGEGYLTVKSLLSKLRRISK